MTIYFGFMLFLVMEYIRPGSYLPALNVLRLNTIVPLSVIAGTFLSTKKAAISASTPIFVCKYSLLVNICKI